MPAVQNPYEFIKEKIHTIKGIYPILQDKSDAYAFSALCVKANFYKNPALIVYR